MPLHRTSRLGLEVSAAGAPVGQQWELGVPGVGQGQGGAGGFLQGGTVTSCAHTAGGSPRAPQSVAVILALSVKVNCQRWLAGSFYPEICFGACLSLGFYPVAEQLQLGLSVAGEDRECC